MNKTLMVLLLKDEIKKMMARVAKCDRRIEHQIEGIVGRESEADRKQRLLAKVNKKLIQIAELGVPE